MTGKELMLRSDALTADEVEKVTFRVTRFKQGYDAKEVDDFLDRVQSEVALLTQENAELRAALEAAAKSQQSDGVIGGGGAGPGGSADLLARRADLERDVNALEAFEREYRTRLKAWIGTMLDELDHPDDVPMPTDPTPPTPTPLTRARRLELEEELEAWGEFDDTSEIPVIRTPEVQVEYRGWKKKKKKKDKKKNKEKFKSLRDFTLPPDDPHGPDRVTQNA